VPVVRQFTPYANSYAVMMNACEKLCKWYFVIEKTPRKCMKLDEYVLFLWRACASACCVILWIKSTNFSSETKRMFLDVSKTANQKDFKRIWI